MIDFNEVYIYSEQPTTCPRCSGRTEIISDFSHIKDVIQIHKCLNPSCREEFVIQDDNEFENTFKNEKGPKTVE